MSTSRKTFTASFDGFCNECDNDIEAGEEVAYVDDLIVCEACWENVTQ